MSINGVIITVSIIASITIIAVCGLICDAVTNITNHRTDVAAKMGDKHG